VVLRVLRAQGRHRVEVAGSARLHERSAAIQLHKRESRPVLVPAIDQDRRAWIGGQVSDTAKVVHVGGSLGLLVER
jgi:hypothetical protein